MKEHIGKILQEKLKEPGMPTVKDFADLLGMSTRTLYNVFNETSDLTMDQVVRASEILKLDLISRYLIANDKEWVLKEPGLEYKRQSKTITVSVHLMCEAENMVHFNDLLQDFSSTAKSKGFKLV